jgi:hypothetical protein
MQFANSLRPGDQLLTRDPYLVSDAEVDAIARYPHSSKETVYILWTRVGNTVELTAREVERLYRPAKMPVEV